MCITFVNEVPFVHHEFGLRTVYDQLPAVINLALTKFEFCAFQIEEGLDGPPRELVPKVFKPYGQHI